MTNMLADAATWIASQQQYHLATSITYRRGGATPLSISATKGASQHQVDEMTGVISWFDQDWLIPADVLTLGEPQAGDVITYGTSEFEVLPNTGENVWRWSDNHETIYRIHSKRIKA
jgi:hypothetical protein